MINYLGQMSQKMLRKKPPIFLILSTFFVFIMGCASTHKFRNEFPGQAENEAIESTLVPDSGAFTQTKEEKLRNETDPVVMPGFLFEIANMEDRKLNGRFRVDFDGQLKLPYNVLLNTDKLRASEVKSRIIASYKKFFQTQSAFTVQLAKREVYVEVRGLVERPGRILMAQNESLESLVSRSGGLKKDKDSKELEPRYLRLKKQDKTEMGVELRDYFKSGALPTHFSIDGGDTLIFQVDAPSGKSLRSDSATIQIMGEVLRPGNLAFKLGADIYYYLEVAGGPSAGANLSDIKIVRGPANNRVIASLDTLEEGQLPLFKPGDIILVPHDKPTKLERNISMSSGVATIISAIVLLFVVF